jgi:transcriptional regulator with PAS, ATPase and Fis domain
LPQDPGALVLAGPSFTVGRGDDCSFRTPITGVSRHHFEVYREGPIYALKDLRSTNGTWINGRRVEISALAPGMVIRAGDWLGVVETQPAGHSERGVRELAPGLFGGAALERVIEPLRRAASSNIPIVLVGATGTGKERFARAVHHFSGRAGAFHAVNSAALPSALAEGELFGYQKGAFTGAERTHGGQFRAAHGGTLFLDEVAEMPLPLQAKLLRAIELGEVVPLGETRPVPFDARLVVACQLPLEELVAQGRFREDLAARLDGLTVQLPPLHERKGDVPGLFWQFLREHSGGRPPQVSTRLYERLCSHEWPGNVRELSLLARQLLAVHGLEPTLRRSHLPKRLQNLEEDASEASALEVSRREEDRREYDLRRLRAAIQESGGNVTLAAERSGISRQRAYRLMANSRARTALPLADNATNAGSCDESHE